MAARGGGLRRLGAGLLLLGVAAGCSAAPPRPATREQLLQRVLPSTVQVTVEQARERLRSGSGVVIARRQSAGGTDCYVLTAGHTLTGFAEPQETYVLLGRHRGAGTKVRARLMARRDTQEVDLALLHVQTADCLAAPLGGAPALGEAIWVVAFPWGRNMTLVGGIVSQLALDGPAAGESAPRFMVDAPVSYGASGGGVFDAETGELVGVVEGYRTARVSFKGDAGPRYIDVPVPGETYVTPLADIRRFLIDSGFAALLDGERTLAAPAR